MKKLHATAIFLGLAMSLCVPMYAQELPETSTSNSVELDSEVIDLSRFEFLGSHGERIDSDGSFWFACNTSITSSTFKVSKTSTTIYASAEKCRWSLDAYDNDVYTPLGGNVTYRIELYNASTNKKVDSYSYSNSGSHTFTGLSTSTDYYIKIVNTTRFADANIVLYGDGSISNYN